MAARDQPLAAAQAAHSLGGWAMNKGDCWHIQPKFSPCPAHLTETSLHVHCPHQSLRAARPCPPARPGLPGLGSMRGDHGMLGGAHLGGPVSAADSHLLPVQVHACHAHLEVEADLARVQALGLAQQVPAELLSVPAGPFTLLSGQSLRQAAVAGQAPHLRTSRALMLSASLAEAALAWGPLWRDIRHAPRGMRAAVCSAGRSHAHAPMRRRPGRTASPWQA